MYYIVQRVSYSNITLIALWFLNNNKIPPKEEDLGGNKAETDAHYIHSALAIISQPPPVLQAEWQAMIGQSARQADRQTDRGKR